MLVHSIHSDWIKKLIFHLSTRKKLALLLPSIHTASNTIPIYFKFHSTARKKRENIEESFHMVYFFWAIFLRRNCNENLFWLKDLLSSLRGIGMCKNHKNFYDDRRIDMSQMGDDFNIDGICLWDTRGSMTKNQENNFDFCSFKMVVWHVFVWFLN